MTLTTDFTRLLATNSTDSSFPSRIPTTTEPSGVISLSSLARSVEHLMMIPFGTGNENDTFNLRVIGWRKVFREGTVSLWVPVVLAECACTMGNAVGIAGAAVTNTERFVDSISLTTGNADVSVEVVSPANNLVGHVLLDAKGFDKIEVAFDIQSGATGMNALYALL